jgi:hypothetical protein
VQEIIVQHYLDHREHYGKTIVFACSIDHAAHLAKRLVERGIPAAAVHCRLRDEDRLRALDRFRRGELSVLVNVSQLTHGVDLPDLKTVFLQKQQLLYHTEKGRALPRLEGAWFPDGFQGTMGELLAAIEVDREPCISAAANLASLELCFAACKSSITGRAEVPGEVRALP